MALTGLALGALAAAWGCGNNNTYPPPPGDYDGGPGRDGGPIVFPEGGVDGTMDSGVDSAAQDGSPPLGTIPIIQEPDTPCVAKGGTSVVVFAANAGLIDGGGGNALPIQSMQTVGSRRVGGGDSLGGFVTFGQDGGAANPNIVNFGKSGTSFASQGSNIGAIGYGKDKVIYQQYDPTPAPVGAPQQLSNDTGSGAPLGLSVAAGAAGTLAVWGEPGYNFIMAGGVPPAVGTLGVFQITTIPDLFQFLCSVTATSTGFAVVYSFDPPGGGTQAFFAQMSLSALTSGPTMITTSKVTFSPTKLVKTSSGFALLANGGASDFYVVPFDGSGTLMGSAHHLVGASQGWDMAVQGTTLGVVATRSTGEPEFRPLDLTGKPTGSWVCLDMPVPTTASQGLAIDVDGAGFAVMYTNPAGADVLVRFSATGQ